MLRFDFIEHALLGRSSGIYFAGTGPATAHKPYSVTGGGKWHIKPTYRGKAAKATTVQDVYFGSARISTTLASSRQAVQLGPISFS